MPLDDIRKKIDHLDQQLLDLLSDRADLVHEVGVIKKKEGLQIYAPEREDALLKRLAKMNKGRLPDGSIVAIYREIMSAALALEDNLTVAYLGPEGTWTHQAAIKKFGHSIAYSSQPNFSEVFDQVARRRAHYGVVPIENSTEGAVSHTLDLFVDSHLQICAQILLRIDHCLLSSIDRAEIKTLYSHPQVFGQCRNWILRNFPDADLVEVSSTTKAAQLAHENAAKSRLPPRLHSLLMKIQPLEQPLSGANLLPNSMVSTSSRNPFKTVQPTLPDSLLSVKKHALQRATIAPLSCSRFMIVQAHW